MINDNYFSKKKSDVSFYLTKPHSNEIHKRNSINRIQIFSLPNSNSKHNIGIQLRKTTISSNYNNPLQQRKTRITQYYDNDSEEKILKEIYRIKDDDNDIQKLSQQFMKVKDCSIL